MNKLYILSTILIGLFSCKTGEHQTSKIEKTSPKHITINEDGSYSTLISQNGHIVFEEYYNGKTRDDLCHIQSLAKGIMAMLIGIAIDQEYISNENESIDKYLPDEFNDLTDLTDLRKKDITIKHLLNQTSGLSWRGYLEHENWINSPNPNKYVLLKKLESVPGENYNYNSGATHLLSVILTKSTGKTTLEFANKFLFAPLDINLMNWEKRGQGYYDGSGLGLEMKPNDLMKIGQLLENGGKYDGKEIISQRWIKKLFDDREKKATTWGLKDSTHGYCWYRARLDQDIIQYGMGYGGQFILIVPNKNLVIITTHNHDTPNGIRQQIKFLNTELPRLIKAYGA